MNTQCTSLFASILVTAIAWGEPAKADPAPDPKPTPAGLIFREVNYDARVTDDEARFTAEIKAESLGAAEASELLFEGDLALLPPKLPAGLRVERSGNQYRLVASRRGQFEFKLELVGRIVPEELWNKVWFKGPAAALASVSAQAGSGMELQLLRGTLLESETTNGVARLRGFPGADQLVALRWSHAAGAEVTRKAVTTVETTASAQITPTVAKLVTALRYEILQGKLPRVSVALPASQTLTRLAGEQVRDWELQPATNDTQTLTVTFVKPVEQNYQLTLYTEQTLEAMPSAVSLNPPQPLEIERESGSITIATEDTQAEIDSATGLRQVNAPAGALAAYRFNGRPFSLGLKLKRIEPVLNVAARVSGRLEESRLLVNHQLTLAVERAGLYALDLTPQPGFIVADVQGEGVEDWKVVEGTSNKILRVSFSSRVLGTRKLEVHLEQPLKTFPDQIVLAPLRAAGAVRETAELGFGSAPGIRLKTGELAGLREVPAGRSGSLVAPAFAGPAGATPALPWAEETLAYAAEQPDWRLSLGAERLAARVVADIFNLITIGDGIVGGSATIRYGLVNQGVQEFEVAVPATWKNVEFTGPNIRRKEQKPGGNWVVRLQDKVWGGYTLVVTYDFQFEPKGATLTLGGLHAVGVEHETGSVAVTTAASLKLEATNAGDPLRRIDEAELAPADRALVARTVLLAYQYSGNAYNLAVEVKRFGELPVLSAVADRTQLTTALTEAGELLTQASFMVKNNDKQFQRFKLPAGADFWSCHVNGLPVKVERDQDWLLVPLPRGANRDQAFAVDIVYAEKKGLVPGLWPRPLQLQAPLTDVPNSYAEWQLYAPARYRLSAFAGNLTVARGTTYDIRDAWDKFVACYTDILREAGAGLFLAGLLVTLVVALVGACVRRGLNGVFSVLGVFCLLALLGAMLLPALSKAKARAQRMSATNNLKQIGVAMRTWALDNGDRFPNSFEDMMNELNTDKVLIDPESGERFIYLGAGKSDTEPNAIVAFSPTDIGGYRNVLLADGSVQQLRSDRFAEAARLGYKLPISDEESARNRQVAAVRQAQFAQPGQLPASATPPATAPVATGIRSLHIDIPRTGQLLIFTKVLNVGKEPLALRAHVMRLQTFQMARMALQLTGFLAGLAIWWWQWPRRARSSFLLALGAMLALASVGNLLLSWRILHLGFIWGAPVLVLAVIGWLTWKYWPRTSPPPPVPVLAPGIPPAVAALVLLCCALATPAAPTGPAPITQTTVASAAPNVAQNSPPRATATAERCSAQPTFRSATFIGNIDDRVARIDAVLTLTDAQAGQQIRLFGDDVAVREFSATPAKAKLLRLGNGLAVSLARRGDYELRLKLVVKLSGDVTKRQLAFGIPEALCGQVNLAIDQPDADVEFPTAISSQHTTTGQQTSVRAVLGATDHVEVSWTPRVKRAGEIAANVICQNVTLVNFAGGVVNARVVLDYQVTQGELRQARVQLPPGYRVLRVEGEFIRTWQIAGTGTGPTAAPDAGQVVAVELLKGIAPNYRLTVECEKAMADLPATIRAEIPHALDVKRETGVVGLRGEEELELALERAQEVVRVDSEEFARLGGKAEPLFAAFRFLKPEFTLAARVAPQRPQIEAVVRNDVRVGPDQVNLVAGVDYVIKRAGVFALKLTLPEDYRLDSVTANNLLQWTETGSGQQRVLELTLKERTSGACHVRLDLSRNLRELPKALAIPGVQPLGTQKLAGFVTVTAEPGVAIQPATAQGLTEIPAASVAGSPAASAGNVLAYKYLPGEDLAARWQLTVATEPVEAWVRAEIVNTFTLTEAQVSGRAQARFEIQNAPVKELRLKIPAAFRNVEITGPNIRRRDQQGELWTIEFQHKLLGPQTLVVAWEQSRDALTNRIELHGVAAAGVERETGILAIVARPPLQVTEQGAADLKPIDTRDLPDWAGRPEDATVLAYRYLRPGYALALEAKRFEEAAVLQALVERLDLTTVVADDGQMMTEMSLAVRNHGRQYLEVALPAGATIWSAFVAGQPVRPSVKDGKLLLPLEGPSGEDAALAVELTYVGASPFPQSRGELSLASPTLDVPLKGARWELFLPPDYTYRDFRGTMLREIASVAETSSFSRFDYSKKESETKAQQASELRSELANARQQLSSGNMKEALAGYNRAKARGSFAGNADRDTQQLEEQLRRAQGSNLVLAQNDFAWKNGGIEPQSQVLATNAPQLQYDAAAAEVQWTKLQRAQELVTAQVQPIRVNLPTRGLRQAFTQVLQTEIGKPLTIRLLAINDKVVSWPKRLAATLGGFLLLWFLVATVTRPSPARK